MFFKRTEEEIVGNAMDELSASTNITQLSPGSTARTLLEIVSREQGRQHSTFDYALLQSFIRFAEDKHLDLLGDMLNVPRIPSAKASVEDDNFIFYVSSGYFGDINGGLDITIPKGTVVSTVPYDGEIVTPGIESQPTIKYVTTEEAICDASDSTQTVPIEAEFEGTRSNVPRNVLNQHNFTAYSSSSSGLLKCTNKFSIATGKDRESPQSYRYRLSNIFKAREIGHNVSIRLAALSVPGVTEVKQVNAEQGPGTFSIYVRSSTPTTSPNLLSQVALSVQSVTAGGVSAFVLAPEPLGVEFVATVKFISRATQQNITDTYIAIRNTAENFINTLSIGEELNLTFLVDEITQASPYISSIGAEKINSFDHVYLYRYNSFGDSPDRSEFHGNKIKPLYNERVILETNTRHHGIKFISRKG